MVEPVRLFEEWVTNYPTKLRPKLNARRFRAENRNWWKTAHVEELAAVWGGEVAADRLTRHLKPTVFTIYLPTETDPKALPNLVRRHRLRADADGDIEVLDKFWNFADETTTPDLAPPILVYADLVATLDPRTSRQRNL